jgi:hypothetical protein
MMPASAHNIHAGKKAPNSANEGAPASEQPASKQLATTSKTALGSDSPVIVLGAVAVEAYPSGTRCRDHTRSWRVKRLHLGIERVFRFAVS